MRSTDRNIVKCCKLGSDLLSTVSRRDKALQKTVSWTVGK